MKRMVATLAAALLLAAPATAATLVNTGQATSQNGGYALSGPASSAQQDIAWAARFALATPAVIASLEAGLQTIEGGDVVLAIYDASLGLPEASAALFSTTVSLAPAPGNPLLTWDGAYGLSWSLDAGSYWFAILPTAGSTVWTSLNFNPPHPLGAYATRQGYQAWNQDSGYTPFAIRIRDANPDPAVVPEPESWIMLMAGFALSGAALRRRHQGVSAIG